MSNRDRFLLGVSLAMTAVLAAYLVAATVYAVVGLANGSA